MNRVPRLFFFAIPLLLMSLVHGAPVPGHTDSTRSSEALRDLGAKLNHAIRDHQPKRVAYLLKKGASHDPVGDLKAPLQTAISYGDTAIFRQLLEAGADPRAWVRDGDLVWDCFKESRYQKENSIPLLFVAARHQNPFFAKTLLERGADPKMVSYGLNAAFIAARFDNLAVFRLIVDSLGERAIPDFRRIADYASVHGAFSVLDDLKGRGIPPNPDSMCKALAEAIRVRDTAKALAFLDRGASVNPKDPIDYTPLMQAIATGSWKLFDLLLDRGANLDAKDKNGESPVSLAARKSDTTWLKRLLDKGAEPHATNSYGRNALFDASVENLPILLSRKVKLDIVDDYGVSPLMNACEHGLWREVEWMIQAGADVGKISSEGESALSFAVARQRLDVIQRLFERGGSLNAVPPKGTTILQKAISERIEGDFRMLTWLLEHGADPLLPDASHRTPVRLAAEHADLEAVALLVRHGAKSDIRPNSAILIAGARKHDSDSLLRLLVDNGCNLDTADTTLRMNFEPEGARDIYPGEPALIQAIRKHDSAHVAKLLRHSANPNVLDRDGVPALLLAVSLYEIEVVKLLLEARVDVSRKDAHRKGIKQYLNHSYPYPQMAKLFSRKVGK
jgi:ankyrin repeat protein